MNLYLDTSALVPLIVAEPTSALCRRLWDDADAVLCTAIGHVEATAAIVRAGRAGRLGAGGQEQAIALLERLWSDVTVVPADAVRLHSAAGAAVRHGLRGYDAVHCAAALAVAGDVADADEGYDLVAASGDRELISAWIAEGLAVVDTCA